MRKSNILQPPNYGISLVTWLIISCNSFEWDMLQIWRRNANYLSHPFLILSPICASSTYKIITSSLIWSWLNVHLNLLNSIPIIFSSFLPLISQLPRAQDKSMSLPQKVCDKECIECLSCKNNNRSPLNKFSMSYMDLKLFLFPNSKSVIFHPKNHHFRWWVLQTIIITKN